MNPETIIGTLSWYKILPRNGFNLIRVKQRRHKRRRKSLRKFLEPSHKPKVIYTDNSMEFGKACEILARNHRTSTPHQSETHSVAGRAVRRGKEGTSAVLLQSGLDKRWWSDSMECYCYLQNVQDFLAGAMVKYRPVSPRDQANIFNLARKYYQESFQAMS